MLHTQIRIFKIVACLTFFAAMIPLSAHEDNNILINPSIHIMVNDHEPIPKAGSYNFHTKIFKVKSTFKAKIADFDLRLTKELKAHLQEKQFTETEEKPDLLVNYAVAANLPITEADFKNAYIHDSAFELPKFTPGNELNYNEGALIIDIVDAKSKKLLWRGAIMAEFKKGASKRVKDRRMKLAVKHLMAHFPEPVVKN